MQTRISLPSRYWALFVLTLILGFGFVAGRQQFRHASRPTPAPAPAVFAESPPGEEKAATALRQLEEFKVESTKPGETDTVLPSNPGWNFVVVNVGGKQNVEAGERIAIRSPGADTGMAEAHNLYRMQRYQERVTRQLNSTTPILPISLVPTLEERIFEDSGAR